MWAIQQSEFGGPEVLRLVDVDQPRPLGTEVLVRVHAAGVNPVDWKTRAGDGYLRSLPLTLGWDVSGVVEAVGPGVTRFVPGDEVFGMPWFPRQAGGYAEYITAPSRQLARKPVAQDHDEAAGLPLAGLTAWQVLVDTADVRPRQRIAVIAAAGGVGHLAVQIAKARGAHVIGVARADRHAFVTDLGADDVIDHTTHDVPCLNSGLDLVFDPIGGARAREWVRALRPGGLLIAFGVGDDPALRAVAHARRVRVATVLVEPDGRGLEMLAALVARGALRVELNRVLPLADAAAAHRLGERGRARGKIVLTP